MINIWCCHHRVYPRSAFAHRQHLEIMEGNERYWFAQEAATRASSNGPWFGWTWQGEIMQYGRDASPQYFSGPPRLSQCCTLTEPWTVLGSVQPHHNGLSLFMPMQMGKNELEGVSVTFGNVNVAGLCLYRLHSLQSLCFARRRRICAI